MCMELEQSPVAEVHWEVTMPVSKALEEDVSDGGEPAPNMLDFSLAL